MRAYLSKLLCMVALFMAIAPVAVQSQQPGSPVVAGSTPPSAAASTAAAVENLPAADIKGTTDYRLGAGDKVRVTVYNEDTVSGEYIVDGSGSISLQLVGAINVVGRSVPEVIRLIENALKSGGYILNPSVSMEVLNYRPFYVIGEVNQPGKYPFVSDMSVLNAVALAGGYTYRAQKKKVMIIRATDADRKEREATPRDLVLPGDIIRVPERLF